MRRLGAGIAVSAASLALATAVWAAVPKHPATFTGRNGMGMPVTFQLGRRARPTYAAVAFACRSGNLVLVAHSRRPSGSVSKSGAITISYTAKEPRLGKVTVRLSGTFASTRHAKGTATLANRKCFGRKARTVKFIVAA